MPPNTVKVCRPGRWGNPFQVSERISHDLAVDLFRDMLNGFFDPGKLSHLSDDEFRVVYDAKVAWHSRLNWGHEIRAGDRAELRGKNLACWCPADQCCHADVLLECANGDGRRLDAALAKGDER